MRGSASLYDWEELADHQFCQVNTPPGKIALFPSSNLYIEGENGEGRRGRENPRMRERERERGGLGKQVGKARVSGNGGKEVEVARGRG